MSEERVQAGLHLSVARIEFERPLNFARGSTVIACANQSETEIVVRHRIVGEQRNSLFE